MTTDVHTTCIESHTRANNIADNYDINNVFFNINFENSIKHFIKNGKTKRKTSFYIIDIMKQEDDGSRGLLRRFILRRPDTFNKILENNYYNKEEKLGIIYRGLYLLKREEIIHYRKAEHINLPSERRLYEAIFIDIDNKEKDYHKIIVSYLSKAGIVPFGFETKRGYHLYIVFEEGFYAGVFFEKYLNIIKDGLTYLIKHKLRIPVDIISYKHPIWLEIVYNKIKECKTRLIFRGKRVNFWHLYNFAKKYSKYYIDSKLKPKLGKKILPRGAKTNQACVNIDKIEWEPASTVYNFIIKNKSLISHYASVQDYALPYHMCLKYCKQIVSFDRFIAILEKIIKQHQIKVDYNTNQKKASVNHNKYVKYKNRIDVIRDILLCEPSISLSSISKKTGISKGTLHEIFKRCPREIIIKNPNFAKLLLTKKSFLYTSDKTIERIKKKILNLV